ncbi:MAG: ATP-dependent DNA helicase RecQ [Planctomycetes bacterium]|nr:ATP-dependent DNA helicase RecQ [Planctomycetota bacterium]
MDDRLLRTLRDRFGVPGFRPGQRPIVEHLLAGGDALVVWPTGSGKSLLYQLPAQVQASPTLVLSPLIALMEDQVAALRARGIEASCLHSMLDRGERERRAAAFAAGRVPLLYVTPERFRSEPFLAAIAGTRVGLLAVDEAHCISSWGHDFRPEYGRVGKIRERLGMPPTIALTATATPAVMAEIRERLALRDPRIDHQGLARDNLFLTATEPVDEAAKWARIATLLRRIPGAGIVYGALIRDLHRLEDELLRGGQRLLVYHGDLSRDERRAMHRKFQAPGAQRVLATRAFGMGIDKPDLRFLLHHQLPGSLEELWQEIGRAGRDGQPSWCELLYSPDDLAIQMQFVRTANPDRRLFREVAQRLAEWGARGESFDRESLQRAIAGKGGPDGRIDTCLAWLTALGLLEGDLERGKARLVRPIAPDEEPEELGPEKQQRDLERLQKVVDYVRTKECRRAFFNRYFGIAAPATRCDACDNCVDREDWLARNLPAASHAADPPATAARATERDTALRDAAVRIEIARGDFVRIDGRWLGRVTRVTGRGRDAQVEVELAHDLTHRKYPARRHKIERLDPERRLG